MRTRVYILALLVVLAVAAFPSVASAWSIDITPRGNVAIDRDSGDVGSATFYVYQTAATPSGAQLGDGSWCSTATGGAFQMPPATYFSWLFPADADHGEYSGGSSVSSYLVVAPGGRSVMLPRNTTTQPVYLTSANGVTAYGNSVTVSNNVNVQGAVNPSYAVMVATGQNVTPAQTPWFKTSYATTPSVNVSSLPSVVGTVAVSSLPSSSLSSVSVSVDSSGVAAVLTPEQSEWLMLAGLSGAVLAFCAMFGLAFKGVRGS